MSENAKLFSAEALRLRQESRYEEALVLIGLAIEYNPDNYDYWNIKALILDDLKRFEESLEFYDRAYELSGLNVIRKNKARTLFRWAQKLHFPDNEYKKALSVIDDALLISPNEKEYWFLKGEILEGMGDLISARKAYYRAQDEGEKLDDLNNQLDLFEQYTNYALINITGTSFYKGLEPFSEGVIVDLIKEPDNEHDPDAVRVDIDGETVGYVANSDYTVIDGILRASELNESNKKAEVLMIYLGELVIARLI